MPAHPVSHRPNQLSAECLEDEQKSDEQLPQVPSVNQQGDKLRKEFA